MYRHTSYWRSKRDSNPHTASLRLLLVFKTNPLPVRVIAPYKMVEHFLLAPSKQALRYRVLVVKSIHYMPDLQDMAVMELMTRIELATY